MNVVVVGLGKLGYPMLGVFASQGHHLIGIDPNANIIEKEGLLGEPGANDLVAENSDRIQITTRLDSQLSTGIDLVFIVVPTPTNLTGGFSTKYVVPAAEKIGQRLNSNHYTVVVLVSTVMPTAITSVIIPTLEKSSGMKCGQGFGVCYNPEFVALGTVIRDMMTPHFVLIGEASARDGDILEQFYATIHNRPVSRMNLVSAEIAKLSLNCYITMKISFANSVKELCSGLDGADTHAITIAIGQDKRVGSRCLIPATAYGGPCFPRDNKAFARACLDAGTEGTLANAVDAINRRQVSRLVSLVQYHVPQRSAKIGVLGLAYKEGTVVTEESFGVNLAEELYRYYAHLLVWDPLATYKFSSGIVVAGSMKEVVENVNILIVTTPSPEFVCAMDGCEASLIIDPWGIVNVRSLTSLVRYLR